MPWAVLIGLWLTRLARDVQSRQSVATHRWNQGWISAPMSDQICPVCMPLCMFRSVDGPLVLFKLATRVTWVSLSWTQCGVNDTLTFWINYPLNGNGEEMLFVATLKSKQLEMMWMVILSLGGGGQMVVFVSRMMIECNWITCHLQYFVQQQQVVDV